MATLTGDVTAQDVSMTTMTSQAGMVNDVDETAADVVNDVIARRVTCPVTCGGDDIPGLSSYTMTSACSEP